MSLLQVLGNMSKMTAVLSSGILTGENIYRLPRQASSNWSFLQGYCLGCSQNACRGILKTNLAPEKVVIVWDNIYQTGKKFFIPVANTSYLLFALAAYTNWNSDLRTPLGGLLGINLTQGVQLALAGGCLFLTIPFVVAFMLPYSVKRMKKRVEMVKVASINQ